MKDAAGKQVAIELLKAMGAPVELCQSVEIELPVDGVATVTLRYSLSGEALRIAGEALSKQ